ncbi:hypothetical protein BXZ70DRAFT_495300 [Cristinia sonorae]|uniref:Fungal-type protein kinase domain-containing protein n=1 Tax=Cristinia sonorae TaxID=1940300 RepID=A0A8K0UIV8_9AGAR|nr:hypothetical protein BXZ70DRAFT_495300 [Cristinia sonorae]
MVDRDISKAVKLVSPVEFLNALLPVDEAGLEAVWKSKDVRTTIGKIPTSPAREKNLYKPFVEAANKIVQVYSENKFPTGSLPYKLRWITAADDPPQANNAEFSLIRPDAVSVFVSDDAETRTDTPDDPPSQCEDFTIRNVDGKPGESTVWWHRVNIPVEIKRKSETADWEKTVTQGSSQLVRYMRQSLSMQPDRRFIFGLLLCCNHLRVFLGDRSGILTTDRPIDIHDNENDGMKMFIRVIIALSTLQPSDLGWDPNMTLYHIAQKQGLPLTFYPSTSRKVFMLDFGLDMYSARWKIQIPIKDQSTGDIVVTDYVATRALSLQRAGEMAGSATLVWVAKKLNDDKGSYVHGPPCVIKQTWHRLSRPTEHDYYLPSFLDNVGKILCSVRVDIDSGFRKAAGSLPLEDNTANIRSERVVQTAISGEWNSGLTQHNQYLKPGTKRGPESAGSNFRNEKDGDQLGHIVYGSLGKLNKEVAELNDSNRVLTRTVIETYGWPLKRAMDLKELLSTIRDAIRGHKELYFKNNTLQRDVSQGNILFGPKEWEESKLQDTFGFLIDLDHAKKTDSVVKYSRPSDEQSTDDAIRSVEKSFVRLNSDSQKRAIDLGLAPVLLRMFGNDMYTVSAYVGCYKGKDLKDIAYMCEQFRKWEIFMERGGLQPSWDDVRATQSVRTGTVAFMSGEILSCKPYRIANNREIRRDLGPKDQPTHSSIHDVESFFWVLVYQGLIRAGPGDDVRPEITTANPSSTDEDLRKIVWSLFDGSEEVVEKTKDNYFSEPLENHGEQYSQFKEDVVDRFSPYFKPIGGLIIRWMEILRANYIVSGHAVQGTIHDQVLTLLDEWLENHKNTHVQYSDLDSKARDRELQRRKDDYRIYDQLDKNSTGLTMRWPPGPRTGSANDPKSPQKSLLQGGVADSKGHDKSDHPDKRARTDRDETRDPFL